MQLLVFLTAYPFLWLVSVLPFRLLYLLSDVLFLLVYYVIGYRKKTVRLNLRFVFPERSSLELGKIEKDFYRHLCDVFLELVKIDGMSERSIAERFHIKNIDVLRRLEREKSVLVVCSHYACWEWAIAVNRGIDSQGYGVYQPIGNRYFDAWARRVRARWNTKLITQKETVKTVVRNGQRGITGVFGMISDQSPQAQKARYWTEFMGIRVPVINGAETMAQKMGLPVVFLKISKRKRGHYEAEFHTITTDGSTTDKNEITDTFLRLVEQQIREAPAYYLWTHKRWKHRNKVPPTFARRSSA